MNSSLGLQESQVSINQEEIEARKYDARIGKPHMKHKEKDKENVEIMSIEEELENFSPYAWKTSYPHDYS